MTPIWRTLTSSPTLAAFLGSKGGEIRLHSTPPSGWALLAASLAAWARDANRPLVILAPSPDRFLRDLRPWLQEGSSSHLFAEVHVSFLDRPPAFDEAVNLRLAALAALASGPALVVTSRRAVGRLTISPRALAEGTLSCAPGITRPPAEMARVLVEMGYTRESLVEARGQFALRGGIMDVFPADAVSPVRLEFDGDTVEAMRLFDPDNQRSVVPVGGVTVRPGRELLLGPERGRAAAERVRREVRLASLRPDVREEVDDDLAHLEAGSAFPGVELYSAYLDPELPSFWDHVQASALVVDFEAARQQREAGELADEAAMLAGAEAREGEFGPGFRLPMLDKERLDGPASLKRIQATQAGLEGEGASSLGWSEPAPLVGNPRQLAETLGSASSRAVIFASEQRERVLSAIGGEGHFEPQLTEVDLDCSLEPVPGLFHADLDLPRGLQAPALSLTVLSDAELFGRVRRPSARPPSKGPGPKGRVSLEFQVGERVVHVDHGIAIFRGMRIMESEDPDTGQTVRREYLELEYADQDRLYVPVENLDRVQKYLGGGEEVASLHRLGSSDWERARQRARHNAEEVAQDLLRIYSQREARAGIAFQADTPWQAQLESSFPYEETPDQLAALAEIKADMESERPMDRLLCGDVGFGKTELALRAAFKAVMSGRQVAVLAPTTILAQQHYMVFSQRLQDFPVSLDVLSRFRTEEDQQRTLAALKTGTLDIVIGTHRLLQKDVRFKRLGLLVIDEEQRFGVMQKERLKRMRQNLDVLSLSATPIPRTLHMAMSGIRDMSVIQTPPEDRQPIKTYVTGDDDELVREVIERELGRGGQVYFVHNRVKTIQRALERVRRLVPRARVAVGHGQMQEDELARVMVDFASGLYDVLVCTTIIESGLDIPNVNTMVVERADRFGLAQLYQLRGRVGRGGKRAYAYFLFDPRRSLTEAADRRLDVLSGLHELGQGFKIALRDLEIRGAGNLLGTEQHGAIAAVGFEMYLQMLQQATERLKEGQQATEVAQDLLSAPEMTLDLPIDHFLPASYIRDERLRLDSYRSLAAAEDLAELALRLRSLRDRFGPEPAQMKNLAFSLRVKLMGQSMGLRAITSSGNRIAIRVDPDRALDVDELAARFGPLLGVRPNRLLLERREGKWEKDLEDLLTLMADLYANPRAASHA